MKNRRGDLSTPASLLDPMIAVPNSMIEFILGFVLLDISGFNLGH